MAAHPNQVTKPTPDRRQQSDRAPLRPFKTSSVSDSDLIKQCADEHRETLRKLAKR